MQPEHWRKNEQPEQHKPNRIDRTLCYEKYHIYARGVYYRGAVRRSCPGTNYLRGFMKKIASLALVSSVFSCSVAAATTTKLEGGYIPSAYADGCDPTTEPHEIVNSQKRYEPRHCTIVRSRNPVFVVSVPTNTDFAADMKLVLISPDGTPKTLTFKGPRLLLPPEHALPAQSPLEKPRFYKWHVAYKLTGSDDWHETGERTFEYDGGQDLIADGAQIREKILGSQGRSHPRLLPREADGSVMAGSTFEARMLKSDLKGHYEATLESAKLWLTSENEPYRSARTVTEPGTPDDATDASSHQMSAITRLAMRSYVEGKDATGKDAYRDDAIRRLMLLARWGYKDEKYDDESATSGEFKNDQANRNVIYTLAFGLDMLTLTGEQQQALLASLKGRLNAIKFNELDTVPYHAHMLASALMSTEAILMASGIEAKAKDGSVVKFEDENAGKLLEDSWNRVVTTLGTWGGGSDSAYGNSVNYAWMSLDTYGRALANYLLMTGENLTKLPALNKFHDNFLAFTLPDTSRFLMSPFGDHTEDRQLYKNYGYSAYRLFALVSGKPIDEWYHQNSSRAAGAGVLPVQHFFLRAKKDPPPVPTQLPPNTYLFEDAGLVAVHSKLTDNKRSSLYFRSSKLGSYNHSHADSNAFTFVSKGRDIFVSGGWYEKYNNELHNSFTRPTRFKNALTFCYDVSTTPYTCAGLGQSEPSAVATSPGQPALDTLDAPGKLVNFSAAEQSKWTVVTGDATRAYSGKSGDAWQPMLLNAVRTVAYHREAGIVFIYDWASSADQRYWQQNLQTLDKPVSVNPNDRLLTIQPLQRDEKGKLKLVNNKPENDGEPVCLRYDGFNGKLHTQAMSDLVAHIPLPNGDPDARSPAQFHTTYTPLTKSNQNVSIMVIAENCADLKDRTPVYSVNGTRATVGYRSSVLTFDKESVTIEE